MLDMNVSEDIGGGGNDNDYDEEYNDNDNTIKAADRL